MITPRVVRELLRRVELAQQLVVRVGSACSFPDLDASHEHLEHVRLTLVAVITSHEQLAGRKLEDIR